MPSMTSKRRVVDDDVSQDESPNPPSSVSSISNKRRRTDQKNGQANVYTSDAVQGEEEEEEEDRYKDKDGDEEEESDFAEGNILPAAEIDPEAEEDVLEDDYEITPNSQPYQPGSIVRIMCKNFVTYTHVEIIPGPNLNMILGPNGTGKSTIVCAICLGLGWNPLHLGRAKEVGAFIKHGCLKSLIEIELQGNEGQRNMIVERTITRENNTSTWRLNGKPSGVNTIQKAVKGFNIQIDNLCQFLPQDRVSEFAHLGPTDLLKETQRAAAPPEMLQWHKSLTELGKKVAESEQTLDNDKQQLRQLEARQAVLQQDVDRIRERQELLVKIQMLEVVQPFIEYQHMVDKTKAAKQNAKNAEKQLDQIKTEIRALTEKPREKKRYKERINDFINARQKALDSKETELGKHKTRVITKLEEDQKVVTAELETERTAEHKRKEEVKKLKNKAAEIKKRLEAGRPKFDPQYFNDQIREKTREMRGLSDQIKELEREGSSRQQEGSTVKDKIQSVNRQKQQLDSVTGQREALLQKFSMDTWKAWEWYQQNKEKFEKEIFGPAMLTCSVKDLHHVDAVEFLISSHSRSFVCQTRNDYMLFTKETLGNKNYRGLGLSDVTIREYSGTSRPQLENFQPPVPRERIKELGCDGYVLDFIKGPNPVLHMLCHEIHAHAVPISSRDLSEQQESRIEELGVVNWVSGKALKQIMRRYGAHSTKVQPINSAIIFKTQQVDVHAKRELERQISELKYQLQEHQQRANEITTKRTELVESFKDLQSEKQKIDKDKAEAQSAVGKYHRAEAELETAEESLLEKQQAGAGYKQRVENLDAKIDKVSMKQAEAAIEFSRMVGEFVDLYNELVKLQLRYAEAVSDEKILESKNEHIIARRAAKEREVQEWTDQWTELKQKSARQRDRVLNLIDDFSQEKRDEVKRVADEKSLEEVEEDIITTRARLDMIHEGNPNAIRQYEDRAARIVVLQDQIEHAEDMLEQQATAVKEIQEKWEPELDVLIAKISHSFSNNFKKIGCAGEVRVHKSDDGFDKWAIQILVKFREEERLQVLDSQRQSGGERAVSTVFYLMALQSLAKSPFRVVDEINQGMDPRNERVVHHRMVNIACQEYTSQYFLITPKLLNDLMYHPRMKIHCIYSGDWVQEEMAMDYSKYLAVGRQLKRAGKLAPAMPALNVKMNGIGVDGIGGGPE